MTELGQADVELPRVLAEFGVPAEREMVYRESLRHGPVGASQLARELEQSEDEVSAALVELRELGIVTEKDGAWTGIAPERAIEVLIRREEDRLRERQARLEAARSSIPDLVSDYVEARRTYVADQVELLTDPELVRSRLFQFATRATTSAWSISPGPALSEDAVAASLPLDAELARRKVRSRMVVSTASLGPAHWNSYLAALDVLGHQVRASDSVGFRMIVLDGEVGIIPSTDAARPGAYVLHGPALVAPLVALFEEVWNNAESIHPDDPAGAAQFTEARLHQVAVLLAKGLKDETIARRLGVSIRTMRRLIAATFEALEADGRFQAGVHAAQRGWLDTNAKHHPS